MQAFLIRENNDLNPIIHQGSLQPDKIRTELLAATIAFGSTFFAAPNIWKMGLALQEIVKLSVTDSLDTDNRLARDLQTGQTFLLWTAMGIWSGFRRKMEVAEGFASVVPTVSPTQT
jgi:hypothetical protein